MENSFPPEAYVVVVKATAEVAADRSEYSYSIVPSAFYEVMKTSKESEPISDGMSTPLLFPMDPVVVKDTKPQMFGNPKYLLVSTKIFLSEVISQYYPSISVW